MRWITGDTHFFHKNIIRYTNRPFKNVNEMNYEIVRRWNSVVGEKDIVYHLGDFSFGNKKETSTLMEKLNGRIILVKGNHDRKKSKKWLSDLNFEKIVESIIVVDNFLLSHYPLYINGIPCLNVGVDVWNYYPIPFPKSDRPLNLCCHVHNKWICMEG